MDLNKETVKSLVDSYSEMTNQLVEVNRNLTDIYSQNKEVTTYLKRIDGYFYNGFRNDICDRVDKSMKDKLRSSTKIVVLSIAGLIGGIAAIIGYITQLIFQYKLDTLLDKLN